MVKSINDIGHVMKKKTIAEFVEDDATLDLLKEIGVDYAQGYGIALPIPLEELTVHTAKTIRGEVKESGSSKWCQSAALVNMRNNTV
jgi:EAL domain-containing protein (putative c-di-GMP-specific phosphodiesterase class I)